MMKKIFISIEKLYKNSSNDTSKSYYPQWVKNSNNFYDLVNKNNELNSENSFQSIEVPCETKNINTMEYFINDNIPGISRRKILAKIDYEDDGKFMCSTLIKEDDKNGVKPKFVDLEDYGSYKVKKSSITSNLTDKEIKEEEKNNSIKKNSIKQKSSLKNYKSSLKKINKKNNSSLNEAKAYKVNEKFINSLDKLNLNLMDRKKILENYFFESAFTNTQNENLNNQILKNELYNENFNYKFVDNQNDEDEWFCKTKLYDDHIDEVIEKWSHLDNEIWCKIICMERNRRVAKAYIRLPYLIITGNKIGFDGYTIGLDGFDNSNRDQETDFIIKNLGKGVRIKIDEYGNLIMRKMCNCSVQIKDWLQQLTDGVGSLADDVIALHGKIPFDKPVKVFDIDRFMTNLRQELDKPIPNRRRIAKQCIIPISFGKNTYNLLNSPCWLMVINVVALRMIENMTKIPEPDYGLTLPENDLDKKCGIKDTNISSSSNDISDSLGSNSEEDIQYYSGFTKNSTSHIYSSI